MRCFDCLDVGCQVNSETQTKFDPDKYITINATYLPFLAQVSYCCPVFRGVVHRASCINFLNFHLLLDNAWLDFNQTWQESSLGVGDSKLLKWYVWPPWGPGGGPQRAQNHTNFKHLLLQMQKENSQVM